MSNRRTGNIKLQNEDSLALGRVYEETPKAVLAAIVCSAYRQLGFKDEELKARIAYEWLALHNADTHQAHAHQTHHPKKYIAPA